MTPSLVRFGGVDGLDFIPVERFHSIHIKRVNVKKIITNFWLLNVNIHKNANVIFRKHKKISE